MPVMLTTFFNMLCWVKRRMTNYSITTVAYNSLEYLNQSLVIQQEIGNIAGLCFSLFNIGHVHFQNKESQKAMQAWVKAYQIAKKINLAQALNTLENLAKDLGLDNGLESWEKLASVDEN